MAPLSLFSIFHLNLAYSSIEEEQRPAVVRQCYWPLVRLAADCDVPIGIEATGYTLERIAAIDPAWITRLRELITSGRVEFVGSGYAQIAGPLVPAEVNAANLRIGHVVYERLLGLRPRIALVNEQAYSAGLVQHYLDAGYRAIVMEWENPARHHPEWRSQWRYLPQIACGQHGEGIPVIWNHSVAFQKFQRFAHGEMPLEEIHDYLATHVADRPRVFSLYCNDAEVFDFRPGRYHTEAAVQPDSEWERMRRLLEALKNDGRFRFIAVGDVLEMMTQPDAGNRTHLESAESPIPVKKQDKYNITRWAVTGRDDLGINTACWRIYEQMKGRATDDDWRELCYLWSSDFRTHITSSRWKAYRNRLTACEARWNAQRTGRASALRGPHQLSPKCGAGGSHAVSSADIAGGPPALRPTTPRNGRGTRTVTAPRIHDTGKRLVVETDALELWLNPRRGLSIDRLMAKATGDDRPLCGTIPHGFFDSIALANDYYSGHLVIQPPGQHKVTDLGPTEPSVEALAGSDDMVISGEVSTPLGPILKCIHVSGDRPRVELQYDVDWPNAPSGSLRLGHVTLIPSSYDRDRLYIHTHQGGPRPETFPISPATPFDHGAAVSSLVTASQALALTNGSIEIGDSLRGLRVECDMSLAALVAMIQFTPAGDSFLFRLSFSASELDDTRKRDSALDPSGPRRFRFALSPVACSPAAIPTRSVSEVRSQAHHHAALASASD